MAVKQDCPICGRKGNEGHVDLDKDEKIGTAAGTVYGGVVGGLIGGPVGAAAGAALGKKVTDWIMKRNNTDSKERVLYRFNCQNPECKHTWTSWIKE